MDDDKTVRPGTEPLESHQFETILGSISDGVFAVDRRKRITYLNHAATAITGVPVEEALGRPCHEVFRTNICRDACALHYTMESERPIVNLAVYITDRHGHQKPVSISTGVFRDEHGEMTGGVETFRDLSVVEQLRSELDRKHTFSDIVSKSPKMQRIFDVLQTVAVSDSTILIEGESGTGKELVARALHSHSTRSEGPFISVNCGALPENLLESELFGYKAGAFTGARRDKPGRFARAEGGTLFLDEIGDMPTSLQVKLLRVLQEREYEPLGGVQTVKTDVRVLAATHVDLRELVRKGAFREDFYYRINVVSLPLPPLRERMEDLPLLVDHFISRLSTQQGKAIDGISTEALKALLRHGYPGNVRELANIVEHGFVLCPSGLIQQEHLPDWLQPTQGSQDPGAGATTLEEIEKRSILVALERNHWNRTAAARELGIHKTTLFRKLHKFGIKDLPRSRRTPPS